MKKSRSEINGNEATRDAIFVFESAYYSPGENYANDVGCAYADRDDLEYRYVVDDEGHILDRQKPCEDPEDGFQVASDDDLVEAGIQTKHWRPESVWATREEAEAYGRGRAYNYPRGWRVYAVPSNGALALILRAHGDIEIDCVEPVSAKGSEVPS